MDILVAIVVFVLLAAGLLGCVLPGLPGPPLSFLAMLLVHWRWDAFGTTYVVVLAILTLLLMVLDYVIPVFSAKLFGTTPQGLRGSIIGMIVGMWFTPVGMIIGVLVGAIAGDMLAGRTPAQALRSGAGTLVGSLVAMGLKIGLALVISMSVFWVIVRKVMEWIQVA